MYVYDSYDQQIVDQRVAQFREQTERFLTGDLKPEEFLPLRLQNGLYVQRHAPMLRIAVPYGLMSARQLRTIADVSRQFDKGYVHFTTRQNIQLNWPALEDVPDILAELAAVQMHAIQTSGNCIRNTTTDQFAGVMPDEVEDPRPWCEIIRQWSTLHPEFAYLPRKFKIAVNAATTTDRAAIRFHDIGLQLVKNADGVVGFQVFVGGGLGRTPLPGQEIRAFLPKEDLLTYLEAILRVYNLNGRRDNKYKARIKILVKALGIDAFKAMVEEQWQVNKGGAATLTDAEIDRVGQFFTDPNYAALTDQSDLLGQQRFAHDGFNKWLSYNVEAHKQPGYAAVTLALKKTGYAPGDATAEQLDVVADLADQYSFGELRVSHQQNLILADVKQADLLILWQRLDQLGFADPTVGTLNDVICCPGGDFCALANAKSIPIAEAIQLQFDDLDYLHDLGNIDLNISGCMNACGHHHIGHIGILGVDKKGEEFYQVSLGGDSGIDGRVGKILGPSVKADHITEVVQQVIDVFLAQRQPQEPFIDVVQRIGLTPFKEAVYAPSH
ncbi:MULTISPECIES: nitrite/sulfite reductase [Reinekea]|jgi:sulfite reductase (NADPH) hemoprotein beta-component|uniref:Sulfite reductase [NADPH] hemoprotein beta-component n=1 Tax=Reinekea forsetii TaxID=1336806 RepID=A0A2K8KRX9_9GAMM|nr:MULTISPECIES: nitrite/sulfite reductase [Reinekea]ATX76829.1 sulfite reductase [NADPH] hemoprotein beta-component [Reinekea forsetii]MDO7634309.1 nitrite/sulfite reductase [Porticoccaceae bacterium]MDO7642145.1 nitrite/sulfite reductase [Reinekea forsetii]